MNLSDTLDGNAIREGDLRFVWELACIERSHESWIVRDVTSRLMISVRNFVDTHDSTLTKMRRSLAWFK